VRFDAFTLDLTRCVLTRGDAEIPLRPKPFDMLRYLVEHPGRPLAKEELFGAVWPGVIVGEDALVKCIRDVRDALGDRGRSLVRTVPKRGYLFDAEVIEVAAEAPAALSRRALPALLRAPIARIEGRPLPPSLGAFLRRRGEGSDPFPARWGRGPVGAALRPEAQDRRRLFAAGAAGVLLLVAAAVGASAVRAPPSLATNAAHYAILGRAILDNERSPKANREALALFAKALAIDPDCVPALLGYARVMVVDVGDGWVPPHERLSRLDQAKAAAERAIRLDATNANAYHLLGGALRLRGDPEGAMAAFERALALNPDNPWTHAEIGRAKIELGRAEEALADISTALRMNPSEMAVHVWYWSAGLAAAHAGKYEEAAEWLTKARRARPTFRVVMVLLAVAYAETGREAEGRALMAEYLALRPGLTMETIKQYFPSRNPTVARQRQRLAATLRRLGVPEGPLRTGSVR
jgi:DNA-binding winged helix-turn-helix (wHTH) protein/cytochrome c-type biogenesis protein CcmH/NrfG